MSYDLSNPESASAIVETLRMQLAACSEAALSNTDEAASKRLNSGHPYYSASYADVCAAVDREIALRAEVDRLKEQHNWWIARVREELGTKGEEAIVDRITSIRAEVERLTHEREDYCRTCGYLDDLRARVAALEAALWRIYCQPKECGADMISIAIQALPGGVE